VTRKLLVIGGDGVMGSALAAQLRRQGRDVVITSRRAATDLGVVRLDLRESLDRWTVPADTGAAVLCAAVTNQEQCLRDPEGTRAVNVEKTVLLAEKLALAGCFVVFLSTNYVFDGTRPAPIAEQSLCPKTEYGRQRAEVEIRLASLHTQVAMIRLTKVFHPNLPIVQAWQRLLRAGQVIEAYEDYVCSPIPLREAVRCVAQIAEEARSGIWQLSASDDISYAGIACVLARNWEAPASLVRAVPAPVGRIEHLPAYATLDVSRAAAELGYRAPSPANAVLQAVNS